MKEIEDYDGGWFGFYWYFGFQNKCPKCKTKMIKRGYREDGYQKYKCMNCGLGDGSE